MAQSVHAAPWTDCHAAFRTSDCRSVHFRNAYWSHHLGPAGETLCGPEHSGHLFSRRSPRPDLLQSLLKDICLVLQPEPTKNKTMSLLPQVAGGAKRAFVIC